MVRPVDPALADKRRQQIMEAASACFRAHGFQQTNMATICSAAGLSAGAVYRYFPSKDALIGAIMEQHVADLRESANAPAGMTALRHFAERILCVDDELNNLRLTAEVFAEARRRPEFLRHLAQTRKLAEASLRDLIASGQGAGHFRAAVDPVSAASSLACVLDGLIFQAITSDRDVMAREAIDMFESTAMAMLTDRAPTAANLKLQPCLADAVEVVQ